MSDENQSPAAPGLPFADSASAEAPAAVDVPATPAEVRCKCGAGPHPDRQGFCANSHPLVGHGGKLSTTHGRYVRRPVDGDVASVEDVPGRLEVLRQVREAIVRDMARSARSAKSGMTPREQAQVLNADDRLADIDARISALQGPATSGASEHAHAGWPQRFARLFANEPDNFTEFLTLLLTADRDACGPLRQQVRLVLDHIEPEGMPVWRGRPDEADEILL